MEPRKSLWKIFHEVGRWLRDLEVGVLVSAEIFYILQTLVVGLLAQSKVRNK